MKNICIYSFVGCGSSMLRPIQAALRKKNFDAFGEEISSEFVKKFTPKISEESTSFVFIYGISTYASVITSQALIKKIRNVAPQIPIFVGGEFPTYSPADTFQNLNISGIVLGDPDQSVTPLAQAIENGDSLHNVPSLSLRDKDAKIISTSDPVYVKHLGEIEYDFSYSDFSKDIENGIFRCFGTSRGCPIRCTFCECSLNRGAIWRSFSAQWVLDFIGNLQSRYKFSKILLGDSDFFVDKKRALDILKGLKLMGIRPLQVHSHVNHLNEELIAAVADAEVETVFLGLETCHPEILKSLHKQRTHADYLKVLETFQKFAPKTQVNSTLLMAFPNQTYEDFLMDIEEVFKIHEKFLRTNISFTCVLPLSPTKMQQEICGGKTFFSNINDLAKITISNAHHYAHEWCAFARTTTGKKALWYMTHQCNYILRFPAFGWIDRFTQRLFIKTALWRIRNGIYTGMSFDNTILKIIIIIATLMKKRSPLSSFSVGDHG